MCCRCRCPGVCGCKTACCCCFRIPVAVGYVFCCAWLLFNGLTFPAASFLFWPRDYLFYGSCLICGANLVLVLAALVNMRYKVRAVFNAVLYGVCAAYLAGGLMVVVGVNVDVGGNSELLMASFREKFGVVIHPSTTFRILQTIQIMYYAYLFASYVYCGFVLQLYQLKHDKRYRRSTFQ